MQKKRRRERSDEERQKRADFDSTPLNLILIGLLSTCWSKRKSEKFEVKNLLEQQTENTHKKELNLIFFYALWRKYIILLSSMKMTGENWQQNKYEWQSRTVLVRKHRKCFLALFFLLRLLGLNSLNKKQKQKNTHQLGSLSCIADFVFSSYLDLTFFFFLCLHARTGSLKRKEFSFRPQNNILFLPTLGMLLLHSTDARLHLADSLSFHFHLAERRRRCSIKSTLTLQTRQRTTISLVREDFYTFMMELREQRAQMSQMKLLIYSLLWQRFAPSLFSPYLLPELYSGGWSGSVENFFVAAEISSIFTLKLLLLLMNNTLFDLLSWFWERL